MGSDAHQGNILRCHSLVVTTVLDQRGQWRADKAKVDYNVSDRAVEMCAVLPSFIRGRGKPVQSGRQAMLSQNIESIPGVKDAGDSVPLTCVLVQLC